MKERIQYLLSSWMEGRLTEGENAELQDLLRDKDQNEVFKEVLDEVWFTKEFNDKMREERAEQIFRSITGAKVVSMTKNWIKWIAAASIVLVMGYGIWKVTGNRAQVTGDKIEIAKANDVPAPKETRAVITLADGTKVYLDSVGNGVLAQQNGVEVIRNENGQIVYSHKDAKAQSELVYNIASNPRGSKVMDMVLNDGTHVWLNAGSSMKYPVAFVGNERKVEITGEAYFEVTHDASKPFVVSKGETSVTVLGTHFNVNAYDDEESLKVTLLEGSVNVKRQSSIVKIVPGEQAVVGTDIKVSKNVDLDEVMAWKNGRFDFDGTDIKTIMRQVEKWYDVEVVYKDDIQYSFVGKISRDVPISDLLKLLEMTNGVHFRVEGKKITVSK